MFSALLSLPESVASSLATTQVLFFLIYFFRIENLVESDRHLTTSSRLDPVTGHNYCSTGFVKG